MARTTAITEVVSGTEQGEGVAAALGTSLMHAAGLCHQPGNAGSQVSPTGPGTPDIKPPGEHCAGTVEFLVHTGA